MRKVSGILADTTELKKLIMEHPSYPIAVLCGENTNSGDYSWMYASDIQFKAGEILDCKQDVNDCMVFNDRVYCYGLYEDMSDWKIRKKCRECGAYVDNATPLKGGGTDE